jgi:Fe-S-cluster-containing hydrogenase component 2
MRLGEGQVFGAMSVLAGRPSESAAVAGPDCVLLETPQSVANKLLRVAPQARAYLERVMTLRAIKRHLMPRGLPEAIHALASNVELKTLAAGDTLFSEGDPIDRLYLILSGSVTLSRKHVQSGDVMLAYCATGHQVDAIGEVSGDERRGVTARTTVATIVAGIDHGYFVRELKRNEELRQAFEQSRAAQLLQYTEMQSKPVAGEILSFLMAHGVGEATNVLVIDESLCVGCDQCERACASTHRGVSRLNRRAGPSFEGLHLPTSCRHCEHPHCMSDCPVDAIHRRANGEISIDDTCIGCGKCEENCPYGVIQIAAIAPKPSVLDLLLRRATEEQAKLAVKCDMCLGVKAGPACVNACPTGAAIRIHAEDVPRLARQRKQDHDGQRAVYELCTSHS